MATTNERTESEQRSGAGHVVLERRHVQRRPEVQVVGVQVGAVQNQQLRDRHVIYSKTRMRKNRKQEIRPSRSRRVLCTVFQFFRKLNSCA